MMTLESDLENEFLQFIKFSKPTISELIQKYEMEIMKLDEFFDLFISKVDMNPDKTDTPEWKLYNKKYEEYELYEHAINRLRVYTKIV